MSVKIVGDEVFVVPDVYAMPPRFSETMRRCWGVDVHSPAKDHPVATVEPRTRYSRGGKFVFYSDHDQPFDRRMRCAKLVTP